MSRIFKLSLNDLTRSARNGLKMQLKFAIQNIIGYEVFETQAAAQQIIGREGETATLLSNLLGELEVAYRRFRPTSIQSFDACL